MFTRSITGLSLTSRVADEMFTNIMAYNNYGEDTSFVATLRALLHSRLRGDDYVRLNFTSTGYTKEKMEGMSKGSLLGSSITGSNVDSRYSSGHQIHIHGYYGQQDAVDYAIEITKDEVAASIPFGDYTELTDVSAWMEKVGKVKTRIFINAKTKCVLIFIAGISFRSWHLVQSLIPRYMPWYFDAEEAPLTEEEVSLLRSLTKKSEAEYIDIMESIAGRFDFRRQIISAKLKGFETFFDKKTLKTTTAEIESIRNRIRDLERSFTDYYTRLNTMCIMETGLREKIRAAEESDVESEMMEFFLCNKGLHLVSAENGVIEFIVSTTISNYDPDLYDSTISKLGKSCFYRHYNTKKRYNNSISDEQVKLLMDAIFATNELSLHVCAAYRLNFSNGDASGLSNYSFPSEILRYNTPNQHIQYYACLGNNRRYITEALSNRDYLGAVSNCCSSASNMNIAEANTVSYFMEKILSDDVGRIIGLPDGSMVTPKEAIQWLEERG